MVNLLGKLLDIFKPAADMVDALHTSDAERLTLKAQLATIQATVLASALEYEKALVSEQAQNIRAEAQAESWITRSWRPLTMLTFVALIVIGQFGGPPIPDQVWPLIQLGLGGYVVGRSVEKVAPAVVKAMKEPEK